MNVIGMRNWNEHFEPSIDTAARDRRVDAFGTALPFWRPLFGLSHSQYPVTTVFGAPVMRGLAIEPTGLVHSPYNPIGHVGYPTPYATALPGISSPYYATSAPYAGPSPWGVPGWSSAELALELVRQQQLTHAIAARQSVLEAMCRTAGAFA